MDCPDTCALTIEISGDRVTHIGGSSTHPITGGFICDKVAQFDRRLRHPDRLLHPLRRNGPKGTASFTEISWDEAIQEIASRLQEIATDKGGEAILPYHYGGSNGYLTDGLLDAVFFARLGASRLGRTLCAAPATAVASGMYGKMPGVAFEDYVHARCIVIWGANPKASNIHLMPYLKEARRRGAFIAAIDPRNTFAPGEVDLHLPVYPGADLPLALGLIRLWHTQGRLDEGFLSAHADGLATLLDAAAAWPLARAAEYARVPAEDIVHLARRYADTAPALIRAGWGLERNQNGGQALAAILAMPALLGKFGVRGGGYTLSNSGAAMLDTTALLGQTAWNTRIINMSRLGAALLGSGSDGVLMGESGPGPDRLWPPIEALWVYNCNPVATTPNQEAVLRGLEREDLFTIVHEQVLTDTARYADIVLPATTFLEHHDLRRSYGGYVAGGVSPVLPAAGQARSNHEVFALVGRALGWTDLPLAWTGPDASSGPAVLDQVARALRLAGRPVNAEQLSRGGWVGYDFPGATPIQYGTVHPQTLDRKVHLTPPELGPTPYQFAAVHSDTHPLALISPASSKLISSTFGEFNLPELQVTLHPDEARARALQDGDTVRVYNTLGEVVCRLRTSERVCRGVAVIPKGAWQKASRNGRTSTALCPDTVNVVGGGACYNDARVEVARAGETDAAAL